MNNKHLDEPAIKQLCLEYSRVIQEGYRYDDLQRQLCAALDVEGIHLQRLWRRALTVATRGTFICTDRARVWMNVNHSVRPVTVMPIASVHLCLRQGVSIDLSFEATPENIKREVAQLSKVLAIYKD